MAVNLTNTWNQHAFPDEMPGREERWSQESEKRRVQDRLDLYLEQSGAGLKLRRFTSDRDSAPDGKSAKNRAADDMMLLAVGSPAYMRAYNTQLRFQIDGRDVEISQGKLYDLAKKRAEELRRQIDEAKQRGATTDEITSLQAARAQIVIVRDNADPALGEMTPERHERIQAALYHPEQDPLMLDQVRQEAAFRNSAGVENAQAADTSSRFDRDDDTWSEATNWQGVEKRSSFAGSIDDDASSIFAKSALSAQFAAAVEQTWPDDAPEGAKTTPGTPTRATGLDL